MAVDRELIVGPWTDDLARAHLEGARLQASPKPTMVSGRFAITRTGTGSPPAGV
jgi:hypothetical protein